jgi:hypothetical protein
MSPRERASFDALSGGSSARTRRYNPNHGGWYALDADKFQAMREYYTKGKIVVGLDPAQPEYVGTIMVTKLERKPRALGPGHTPKAICQTSSC